MMIYPRKRGEYLRNEMTAKQIAEINWSFATDPAGISAAALMRIAAATERMAQSYIELQMALKREQERAEAWKRDYLHMRDQRDEARRRIASLRGVITRMKRQRISA